MCSILHYKMKAALRHFFRLYSFRPRQIAALLPVLHGKDVLTTGSGKSLCFLLVPLAVGPSAVGIISLLKALMDQQEVSAK